MHRRVIGGVAAFATALVLAAPGLAAAHHGNAGYVYTETNASTGNASLAYAQGHDGRLALIGTLETHGTGTGTALATQGEVILAGGVQWVLAVNAASNDVSVFLVRDDGTLAM